MHLHPSTHLELVNELINHVPQPNVGQLHVDVAVQEQAKQVAVVVPRLAALSQGGRAPCIQVAEVQLLCDVCVDDGCVSGERRGERQRKSRQVIQTPSTDPRLQTDDDVLTA